MEQTNLFIDIKSNQWPIVYSSAYNINFFGLEKLHPFDGRKWKHIIEYLNKAKLITDQSIAVPNDATKQDLLTVHSKKFLKSLKCSFNVALIAEVLPLCLVPNFFVQRALLKPMRFQTGGSVLAGKLALERGWAINIGGGFHHCSSNEGGGFCFYADITLLIKFILNKYPQKVKNVMIIDLDAHQGNGHARDFKDSPNIYVLDVYNKEIYPHDYEAKKYISRRVEIKHLITDEEYLKKVESNVTEALQEFNPDLVVYNAGTDILKGDPLGFLSISSEGIILRDEIVFSKVRSKNIPIVMLLSGGYLKLTARIIATSIMNLHDLGLIDGPPVKF